jgi:hypothetical protein
MNAFADWVQEAPARHTAVLALIVLAIMSIIT